MVRQWQELFYKERFSGSNLTAKGGDTKRPAASRSRAR